MANQAEELKKSLEAKKKMDEAIKKLAEEIKIGKETRGPTTAK
jgi:hypothetical protein